MRTIRERWQRRDTGQEDPKMKNQTMSAVSATV